MVGSVFAGRAFDAAKQQNLASDTLLGILSPAPWRRAGVNTSLMANPQLDFIQLFARRPAHRHPQ